MAYSELIKNFNRIRSYLCEFYVFGFRHRSEYVQKSSHSYNNERRHMENWLVDYMSFRQCELPLFLGGNKAEVHNIGEKIVFGSLEDAKKKIAVLVKYLHR